MHNVQRYKDRLRVRVCGILVEDKKILLEQIHSPISDSLIWMPPGGELEFGESIEECLKREFEEETSIKVSVHSFGFINELIEQPFHALELYYTVQRLKGEPDLGSDPELGAKDQLLKDLQWIPVAELNNYKLFPDALKEFLGS